MHPDNCEWCNALIHGKTYSLEFTQERINYVINEYNRCNANGKAKIWDLMNRYNEWPKAGDRRGEFCSQRCLSQAVGSNFIGKWQARSWHGLW